mgnify:CR=1 FL=1
MPLPNPEILYYGCLRRIGHFLNSKQTNIQFHETPWGYSLDEDAVVQKPDIADGKLYTAKKDGWTAVGFWDRSVDSRPNSKSIFLVAKDWPTERVMAEAEKQWPEVCGRPRFPVKAAVKTGEEW